MGERDIEEFLDNETGETNQGKACSEFRELSTNAETGEPEVDELFRQRKICSPVNHSRLQPENSCRRDSKRKTNHERYFQRQQIKFNFVKEVVICTKENVGPMVFILPTLLICPGWGSVVCLLGEAYMHIWSHKRNRKKKNSDIEYRSPLHLISSQFCIHCRSQKWMEKISKIQDKRTLRRKLIYPNFMRRLVR